MKAMILSALAVLAPATAEARTAPHPDYFTAPFTMERVLDWGERPDWSPDGKKLVFTRSDLADGPAYELDLATRKVRCLTCRFGANGFVTRIYYLADGSFLILGPPSLQTAKARPGAESADTAIAGALYWMPASADFPPQPLGTAAWGELAVQRVQKGGEMRIAWGMQDGAVSQLVSGTVVHDGSRAALVDRRIVYAFDARKPAPGAPTFAEAYNISADGSRAMFWSVDPGTLDSGMYEVDIASGRTREIAATPAHNETHVFPDETYGLEESNRASDPDGPLRGISSLDKGSITAIAGALGHDLGKAGDLDRYAPRPPLSGLGRPFDLYVVAMNGEERVRRLTEVSELGGNAHQSVPNEDGKRIAFALKAPQSGPLAGKGGLYIGRFGDGR